MDSIIRRATAEDVEFIDSVVNHADVRPFMAVGDHSLTYEKTIEYALTYVSDYGVIFGENIGSETFLCLVAFKPEGRGLHAMLAMREAIKRLFTETECRRIVGTIQVHPTMNRKMVRACSMLGFQTPRFMGGRAIVDLEYPIWAITNPDCYAVGGEFMDALDIKPQADDQAGALGAFLMTARNGLVSKAVNEYEAYAILTQTKPVIFSAEADRLYFGDKDITDAVMTAAGA